MLNNTTQLYILNSVFWIDFFNLKTSDYHPGDVWCIERFEKPFSMANVREIHHFASQSPLKKRKIGFIHGIDTVRKEVVNGLLKIVEEPPSFLQLILLSESAQILPTILSRSVVCLNHNYSAKINSEKGVLNNKGIESSFSLWSSVLESAHSNLPQNAQEVKQLLYLHTLQHSTVQVEKVLEGFSNIIQND